MLGLRLCFLPQEQYCSLKAFDTPLRHEDLSPYPESATRRSGAYRDGTFTRKSETAGMLTTSGHPFRTHHGGSITRCRRPTQLCLGQVDTLFSRA